MFPSVRMRIVKTFLAAVAGLPDYQTDLKNPNFAKLAEGIGMMGVRIENPADVSSGLKSAHQHSGPGLIDVVTDPNALSLPSHIEPEMVVGFGLTMGKLVLSDRIDEIVDTIKTNIRHYENSFSHSGTGQLFLSLSLITMNTMAIGSEFPLNDNPGSTAGASAQI